MYLKYFKAKAKVSSNERVMIKTFAMPTRQNTPRYTDEKISEGSIKFFFFKEDGREEGCNVR